MIVHLGLTLPVLRGLDSTVHYCTVLYRGTPYFLFVMIALEMMCCVGRCQVAKLMRVE